MSRLPQQYSYAPDMVDDFSDKYDINKYKHSRWRIFEHFECFPMLTVM